MTLSAPRAAHSWARPSTPAPKRTQVAGPPRLLAAPSRSPVTGASLPSSVASPKMRTPLAIPFLLSGVREASLCPSPLDQLRVPQAESQFLAGLRERVRLDELRLHCHFGDEQRLQ